MSSLFIQIILVIGSYLLGSISTAVLVSRGFGQPDPRQVGSGNPGATNVLRSVGKRAAAMTLLGDMVKGALPVLIANWLGMGTTTIAFVALAALIGHCYPIFFQFKGGKGVATAFGALLVVHWAIGLSLLAVWLIVFTLSRISSLSAIIAALTVPMTAYYTQPENILILNVMALLVIWRHYENILKLFHGDETNFKKRNDNDSSE